MPVLHDGRSSRSGPACLYQLDSPPAIAVWPYMQSLFLTHGDTCPNSLEPVDGTCVLLMQQLNDLLATPCAWQQVASWGRQGVYDEEKYMVLWMGV